MNMFQASVTQTKEVSISTEEKKCSIIFIKEFIYLYKTTVVVARHGDTVTWWTEHERFTAAKQKP